MMKAPKQQTVAGKTDKRQPFLQRKPSNTGAADRPFVSPQHSPVVQPKLTVNKPGDAYEQEADRMAEQVMRMPVANAAPPMISRMHAGAPVQRQCAACAAEAETAEKETGPKASETIVQRKCEPEVQRKCEPEVQRKCEPEVQRKCEPEVQRLASTTDPTHAPDAVTQRLIQRKGRGNPLPPALGDQMGQAFHSDFSDVRLHTDPEAAAMSSDLNAQAFTYGQDVYFNAGKYQPGTAEGRGLLGHELTHTVQQGGGAIKRAAKTQKKPHLVKDKGKPGLETALNAINATKEGKKLASEHGLIQIGQGAKGQNQVEMRLRKLKPKEYLWKHEFNIKNPVEAPKPGQRKKDKTAQDQVWKKEVKETVRPLLEALIRVNFKGSKIDDKIYSIKMLKADSNFAIFVGSFSEILDRILVPFWDIDGQARLYDIEHMLDYQLIGKDEADKPKNLILLEQGYNRSLGGKLTESIVDKINEIKSFYSLRFNGLSDKPDINRKNFAIFIESIESKGHKPENLPDWRWYSLEDVKNENPKGCPYKKHLIDIKIVTDANIGKGKFVLITSKDKKGIILPIKLEQKEIGGFKVTTKVIKNAIESISFEHNVKDKKPNLKKKKNEKIESKCELVTDNPIIPNKTYKLSDADMSTKLAQKLSELISEVNEMSPIDLNGQHELDDFNFSTSGKVIPTLSIFKDADINFFYENGNYKIEAGVSTEQITKHFPKPFKIHTCNLSISAGSDGPLSVSGMIGFNIPNFGEGEIEASVSEDGVELEGDFIFEGNYFDKPCITFGYKKGDFYFGGCLKIGPEKIRGLKEATLNVSYEKEGETGKLCVAGSAKPNIKGIEDIALSLQTDQEGFFIAANVLLGPSIHPNLKEGSLTLSLRKGPDGYEVQGAGYAVADIPGVKNARLEIEYNRGAILIKGEGNFKIGKADGKINFGITNRVINNNQPTDEIAEGWTVFGGGEVFLKLGKDDHIAAKIRADLQPDGDLIASGNVEVDRSKDIEALPGKRFEKNRKLLNVTVPIFKLPIGVTLDLTIEAGASIYAALYPPRVESILLKLDNFNLSHPESNPGSIGCSIAIGASAQAGLALSLTLTAELSLAKVAKIKGVLEGSIGLDAVAQGVATLGGSWSQANGLQLDNGAINLCGSARFLAKLTGSVRAYLDLWLTTITLYSSGKIDIASVEFGDEIGIGMNLPVNFEDGQLKLGEPNEEALQYPDVTSDENRKTWVKGAVQSDEKFQPPPPPSKENAIIAVKKLPAGPIDHATANKREPTVLFLDLESTIDFGFISRDTYLFWLRTKYPGFDWTEVVEARNQMDRQDFEALSNLIKNSDPRDMWSKAIALNSIDEFRKDHFNFSGKHSPEINALKAELLSKNTRSTPEQTAKPVSRKPLNADDPPTISRMYDGTPAQRPHSDQQAGPEKEAALQRQTAKEEPVQASAALEERLQQQSGQGDPLPPETREQMEQRFGADLSDVRLHTDPEAAAMSSDLNAQAFTYGNDIYFNAGKYQPKSKEGQRLLAHELTHTVQQKGQNRAIQRKGASNSTTPEQAPRAEALIAARFPFLASVLDAGQIKTVQNYLDYRTKKKRAEENLKTFELQNSGNKVHISHGQIMYFEGYDKKHAALSARIPKKPNETGIQVDTTKLLDRAILDVPTWNAAAEREFRERWVLKLVSIPVTFNFEDWLPIELCFDGPFWGEEKDPLPNEGGRITFDNLLSIRDAAYDYYHEVRNSPLIQATRSMYDETSFLFNNTKSEYDLEVERRADHPYVRRFAEYFGGVSFPANPEAATAYLAAHPNFDRNDPKQQAEFLKAFMSKVALPSKATWGKIEQRYNSVVEAYKEGRYEAVVMVLPTLAEEIADILLKTSIYRGRVLSGAGRIVQALEVVKAGSKIALTIGGGVAGKSLGLLGVSLGSGAGAGLSTLTQELAVGNTDVGSIIGKTAKDAMLTSISTLIGGALAGKFQALFNVRAATQIPNLGLRTFLANRVADVASGPLTTSIEITINGMLDGKWPKNMDEFLDRVAENTVQQVIIGGGLDLADGGFWRLNAPEPVTSAQGGAAGQTNAPEPVTNSAPVSQTSAPEPVASVPVSQTGAPEPVTSVPVRQTGVDVPVSHKPLNSSIEQGTPTFGNIPGDTPMPTGYRRVKLIQKGDVWHEFAPGRNPELRTAKGHYDFVVIDGGIWAVRANSRFGHTEAASGGRVSWAGQIRFQGKGTLREWSDASGHYLPSQSFAKNAGLPLANFVPYSGPRPTTGPRLQLPVFQPQPGGAPPVRIVAEEANIMSIDRTIPLSASGFPGSTAAHHRYGAFDARIRTVDGLEVDAVVKILPKGERFGEVFLREVEGAKAAALTGIGPKFYGVIPIDDGFAFAMGKVRGSFTENFATPGSPEYLHAEVETQNAIAALTPEAPRDVRRFGDALLKSGYSTGGDLQGLIGPDGHWRPIDFSTIQPLPTDPVERLIALRDHHSTVEAEANLYERILAEKQSAAGITPTIPDPNTPSAP